MANCKTEIKRIEFIIEPELTHCNIYMTSDEPTNPFWGNGWRTKTFPTSKSAIDIMKDDVSDYLKWKHGREGVTK